MEIKSIIAELQDLESGICFLTEEHMEAISAAIGVLEKGCPCCGVARIIEKRAEVPMVEEITPLLTRYIGECSMRKFGQDKTYPDCGDITKKYGKKIQDLMRSKQKGTK